ncbi:MAG: class I SAM-dependent methyltransferase [Candidatus Afipia apatlaquensis]|uniref:Class I SAM-dependent methyltransferase n=1 Tax=Candidatus Afipia apatlaquensis TaxID=2712852 RepID=A0A7C9VSM0_9BRAD|nr:class I SAM-dependent methyltransferase [Candidatus Afipia apatlaquensis]
MNQREFFNSMAEKWDVVCKHDTHKINYFLELLNIENGAKVLDVGTGTGVLIPYLTALVGANGSIVAVDASDKMLEVAKSKYHFSNVSFVCGDVLESNIPKNYFDSIICYSVFPHFQDKQKAIKIISQYLKKEGKFIICHSQSREHINNIHRNVSEAVAKDDLPDADTIKEYFLNSYMNVICKIDNSDMFVIIAQK